MGKVALLSLNMIFLVAYKFFFGGEVEVRQNFPDEVMPGETFVVEVVIDKGEHEGFAKWQQELPKGFVASSIESEDATFSFKNNTIKFIWMALPLKESFTIKYQIKTDTKMEGDFEIKGKFSFIEDNERRDVEAEPHNISVKIPDQLADIEEELEEEVVADTTIIEETEEVAAVEVEEAEEDENLDLNPLATSSSSMILMDSKDGNTLLVSKKVTNTKKVKIDRTIYSTGAGTYLVELHIDKDGLKSFGKVEEYIPEGYVANEFESGEGRFSMEDNVLKILWMSLPENREIKISYEMQSLGDELDSATVHGVFSFLRGDESSQLAMKGTRFPNTFEAEAIAEEPAKKEVEEVVTPVPVPKKEELAAQITSVPAPEANVQYRVQIAAAKREVGQPYFIARHGVQETVTIDFHSTWYKYMIGSFGVYKEARDRRNEIWADDNKIDDAFVTAYNAGERISVQEALMTTKQKWYK
jgi:hypothetical protein